MGSNFMEEELVREISGRRTHVLQKFADFEKKAVEKRHLLVQSGQLQRFLRTAAEFSQTIELLIETAENVTIRHSSEHLARVQKILNRLRAEVDGKRGNVVSLDKETVRLVENDHFATEEIQKKSHEIHVRWDYLLSLLDLKWMSVERELDSLEFARKCEFLLDWIQKTKDSKPTGGQKVFDEIRKFSVTWNEISTIFQQLQDPSVEDQANYDKVREEWAEFQIFVDSLLKELDENERIQRFVENSEDVKAWIQEKENEILGKYSKMDVEEAMRYRKTIEIEIKSTEKRIQELKDGLLEHLEDSEDSDDLPELKKAPKINTELQNHVDSVQERFEIFQKFIEKWRSDLANAADLDNLMRESEEILYWCAEKSEDLKVMKDSDNVDLDEISVWIEANSFDFNSWDSVVEAFETGAEKLLEKLADSKLSEELEKVREQYAKAKETAESTNIILEQRIKTIGVQKLIFQTHQKAAHLVTVLQKIENDDQDEDRKTDELEKDLRMNDGVAVRCASVVEQIETVEEQMREDSEQLTRLSRKAAEQLNQLADMKEILKTSASERKSRLQHLLDAAYFLDSCREIRMHTENVLRDGRIKKEAVAPMREQLDTLAQHMTILENQKTRHEADSELQKARENLEKIEEEYEKMCGANEARKVAERTEKFVERVQTWIEQSQMFDDEPDGPLQNQHLRRVITSCKHLLSASEAYKKAIDERRADLTDSDKDDEPRCLLDGIQKDLEDFDEAIRHKSAETEKILEEAERMTELNSHIEWIKAKIKSLATEPVWDSLLAAQKMLRRYEKDSEEIEGRRKSINDCMIRSDKSQLIEEIEHNWNRMKAMFDDRGGVLERMIKLFQYDEESNTTAEWLREKMIYADAIEPKDDESINRVQKKKLEVLADDVDNYKPRIVETHALLEDALVTPNTKDAFSPQVLKFKSALTRKQGEIESDYVALKRLIEKKLKELRNLIQDSDIIREIAEMEKWIEEEEALLNRQLSADSDELAEHLDDVTTNLQRRRANLTEIKCQGMCQGQLQQTHRIDEAFSMLDVFSFELDRIRQRAQRAAILKALTAEVEDVIGAIQTTCEKIEMKQSIGRRKGVVGDVQNFDGDLETLRRRVIASLNKAKDVRSANAELAPQVYDLEERLEKEWTEVSRAAEERKKRAERGKMLAELEQELIDMEQWIDTFNEEVIVVTGGIHDGLGVQVGLESIDTWREELSHRVDQLGGVKNLLASVLNTIPAQDQRNQWLGRVADVESDLVKARKTIDAKQDELNEFSDVLGAERDCDRLWKWANGKREQLETDGSGTAAKTVMRRMNEIEKMMISRVGEVEQLRQFVEELKKSQKPSSFKNNELEEKFERLDDEWQRLEDELRRREVDLNESMSQLLMDEQFEKIQTWIRERSEQFEEENPSITTKPSDIERRQKQYEKLSSEIAEYLPIYEDFLRNGQLDEEKVTVIREMWSSLIETTTIRQKALGEEIQKNRLLEMLDDLAIWLSDAETEVHSAVNFTSLYSNLDAEKATRRLITINEQAGDKDDVLRRVRADPEIDGIVEKLRNGLAELMELIKINCEDLEIWKSMQDVVKAMDDEICWFKELSVIVSSTDVGHDTSSLEVNRRKHQRMQLETERRKQKVAKIIDKTTDLMSRRNRPSLYSKIDEIDEKLGQMTELIENNRQIADIRTHRIEKWADYFQLIDELREKEHALEHIWETVKKTGIPAETLLAEVERKIEVLETIGEQMDPLKRLAEEMTSDEVIRMKAAENQVDKLKEDWQTLTEQMLQKQHDLQKAIQKAKFSWRCDTACQCIRDQEEKIANLVKQKKPTSNFEQAAWHGTQSFVESYERETIRKLKETVVEDDDRKLESVEERLAALKRQLGLLEQKIENDQHRKEKVQKIQDDYSKHACELANWLEQAEEDVADVVWFQTKDSSEDCRQTLLDILDMLRNEKVEVLGELELLEVELAELNEDVNTFTWYSYKTLASRMERLDQTISDRVRIVDDEIRRHLENEKICEEAARTLNACREVLVESKKELEALGQLKLDEQRQKLQELIEKVKGSGMISELEQWRSLMGSRYIFDNKFTAATPHGVLVDTCHCLELMSSMLRSVEQSIGERNHSGVTEKQLREFEMAFEYFDRERKGWLDYERFELCLKSQGYEFTIETATVETMQILDPTTSGRIQKTDYMRWMVKNETTNIYDDHSAIEEALKSLDARKLSDSMSRKEAEFFMRKIAKHTETFTEHIHLEYKDFVDSFY